MNDRPILICWDGSDGSRRSIQAAADLLGQRHAVVVDVGPFVTAAQSVALTTAPVGGSAFEDLNLDDAQKRAQEGAAAASAAGFLAEPRGTVAAPTWEGVLGVADEIDAALIVIGSRGLTGAREQFEGSLSHELIKHSGRPVLVVPPTETRR